MSPSELVREWIVRFNEADADRLAALYHVDAINHQVALEPVRGRAAIRAMFVKEFAATEMVCIPELLLEDGPWAILEWKDPLGLRGCGFFKVENHLITFQRGYWDRLTFLQAHGLPIPSI